MVARKLTIGVLLGLGGMAASVFLPDTVAEAAHPAWSSYATQAKRPVFRPWNRSEVTPVAGRWRPQAGAPSRSVAPAVSYRRQSTFFAMQPRQAVPTSGTQFSVHRPTPVRPAQAAGTRFRPNGGFGLETAGDAESSRMTQQTAALQAQFRPADQRRKRTYEELQRDASPRVSSARPANMMAYMQPMPLVPPMFGGYLPAW